MPCLDKKEFTCASFPRCYGCNSYQDINKDDKTVTLNYNNEGNLIATENTDKDNVNHPDHYINNNHECIDIMIETQGKEAVLNFCICNAFKYIYRHNNKNGVEDIKKANWYLNKYLELYE